MPPKANPSISKLKKQNENMQKEIEDLKDELKKVEENFRAIGGNGGRPARPDLDTERTLNFIGEEYDDLNAFRKSATDQLEAFKGKLESLSDKVKEMAEVLDEVVDYSYRFNVKLIGVPEIQTGQREPAIDMAKLCVSLFSAMGATNVDIRDIDTAHRVPARNPNTEAPKPIICKFTRRLARDEVMAVRREITNVPPSNVGLSEDANLSRAIILDHLSPKLQELLSEAKKFRMRHQYAFCWCKNSAIFLRETSDSRVIKLKDMEHLQSLAIDAQELELA